MKHTLSPQVEKKRLEALGALQLMDTPPEERFDRITRLAARIFGVPIALVTLVDARQVYYKSRYGLTSTSVPREVSFCGHAILDAEPLVIPDTHEDDRFRDNPLVRGRPGIRFYAGCPIAVEDGSRVGALCLIDREPRKLNAAQIQILLELGKMVEEQLDALKLATVDELTGLTNRRGFLALGKLALDVCRETGRDAAVLVFDLDLFKEINDTQGHAAGDDALRETARLLLGGFRDSDSVARIGGDEFCVLMTGTPAVDPESPAARFRELLETRGDVPYALSCSVGIARFDPRRHDSVEALLAEADAAMYRDKEARRKTG